MLSSFIYYMTKDTIMREAVVVYCLFYLMKMFTKLKEKTKTMNSILLMLSEHKKAAKLHPQISKAYGRNMQ